MQFVPKFLVSIGVAAVVILCAFVSAYGTAFSISFPVFSCDVLYACVISILSLDSLFVKFPNSSVIMLNCLRIMVY